MIAMAALEFDDYALLWWKQMLSDIKEAGQGVPKHYLHEKRNESKICS